MVVRRVDKLGFRDDNGGHAFRKNKKCKNGDEKQNTDQQKKLSNKLSLLNGDIK